MKTILSMAFLSCLLLLGSFSSAQADSPLVDLNLINCTQVANLNGVAGVRYVITVPLKCSTPVIINVPTGSLFFGPQGSLDAPSVTINAGLSNAGNIPILNGNLLNGNLPISSVTPLGSNNGGSISAVGSNNGGTISIGSSTSGVQYGTLAVPSYDFDYKLVAIDALTKGAISLDTKKIELGVLINNKSINVPPGSGVTFQFDEGYLKTARGLHLQAIETNNILSISSSLASMGKQFIYADISPTTLTKRLPQDVILANVTITATVASGLDGSKIVMRKSTEDIVYTFSNDELIPVILRNTK